MKNILNWFKKTTTPSPTKWERERTELLNKYSNTKFERRQLAIVLDNQHDSKHFLWNEDPNVVPLNLCTLTAATLNKMSMVKAIGVQPTSTSTANIITKIATNNGIEQIAISSTTMTETHNTRYEVSDHKMLQDLHGQIAGTTELMRSMSSDLADELDESIYKLILASATRQPNVTISRHPEQLKSLIMLLCDNIGINSGMERGNWVILPFDHYRIISSYINFNDIDITSGITHVGHVSTKEGDVQIFVHEKEKVTSTVICGRKYGTETDAGLTYIPKTITNNAHGINATEYPLTSTYSIIGNPNLAEQYLALDVEFPTGSTDNK